MSEHVVNCGCGRTMAIDAPRGRGAYRCGCGTRIKVTAAPEEQHRRKCWWPDCTTVATTEGTVAFCEPHLGAVAHEIASPEGYRALWAEAVKRNAADRPPSRHREPVQLEPKPTWVYFMRRETLIKIGYSNDPKRRAQQINAELLAWVRGDRRVEANLHRRFIHLHDKYEWFRPGADLLQTINILRTFESLPPITADPKSSA